LSPAPPSLVFSAAIVRHVTPPTEARDQPTSDRFVLVVDEIDVQRLVEVGFGPQHFRVTVSANPEQTLAMARDQRPDLIVVRSGIDGIAVAEQLKGYAATASIPVLAMMGQSCPDLHRRAECAGFDALLLKPVTATTLAQIGGLLIDRAVLLRQRSAKLRDLAGQSSARSIPAVQPPQIAAEPSPGLDAPRCRSCGSNADSQLVRATASSLRYRCGSCQGRWRNTRRSAMPQDHEAQVAC
jgi:CheY-like chemotaxis protein